MRKLIYLVLFMSLATSVYADDLGCFEPNMAIQLRLSVLSANTISGVTSDLRYPDDTQVSTPTMTQINGNAYKTSYTVPASPSQTGGYFLYYYYTDGSTVYSSSNRGPFDSFTIRNSGQCGTTPLATGTENASQTSTTTRIYTALSGNSQKYLGMCLENASTGIRRMILGYGGTPANYFDVRAFASAPADQVTLNIYPNGCM